MRYDVRVLDRGGRFDLDHEQDEPLTVGEHITLQGMSYQVVNVQPLAAAESDEFDAILEVN